MFTLGMEIEAASPLALSGATHFYDALRLTGIVDGGAVASWTDMSGNANHAVQATGTLQPIFHTADADDGLPYIAAADTADYLTVPVTADATRTIFIVAKNQGTYPTTSLISYDGNNLVSMLLSRWIGYKKSAAGHAGGIGYTAEWSVIALRQNSATSLSLFVDGVLAETFTPENANWSTLTSFKIGAGHGWIRQFAIFDRALTDTEVERQATWLRAYNGFTWEFEYIDFPGNFPPTLPSPALVVKKEGLTGSRPLVILNHQAGSTERVFRDSGNWRVIVSALVEAGYIVAMSRMWDATSFENTWGNNAALAANDDLYAHLVANHDIDTDKVAMIGASMGGLATALAFPLSAIPLKGAAFYDAVLDLAHIYPSQSAGINSAYAISGGNPYATATAGHDPRLRAASDWAGVRLRFYRNTADVTVDPTQNTADFSAQVAGVATESAVVSYAGGHLANIELTVDDLMAFLERCFT
jgi:dienelactone hydrolase